MLLKFFSPNFNYDLIYNFYHKVLYFVLQNDAAHCVVFRHALN